ncbi:MAG TPA: hypothetical protein VL125_08795 [Pelobium sp.]|nr:hypothetical protein [Pelobium sp.]
MTSDKEIIFILPHFNLNTTSNSRFKSFIGAFIEKKWEVKIVTFRFPIKRNVGLGHEFSLEPLEPIFAAKLNAISPNLNFIKKCAFWTLNKFDSKYWKVFNWFHQVIYGTDIFSPGKVDLGKLGLNKRKQYFVMACGGPFGIYSYANELAKQLDASLILDYRDPWTYGYPPLDASSLVYRISILFNRNREFRFLENAKLVITVSDTLKKLFPSKFHHKIKVLENGSNFKVDDVVNLAPKTFNIVYLGTIYKDQLFDMTIFRVLSEFIKHKNSSEIKLQFIGSLGNKRLTRILKKYQLTNSSEITGRLGFAEVKEYLNNASVFLQLKYGQRSDIITSKQADYLLFRKPIFLPISDYGDLYNSIKENNAGFIGSSVEDNLAFLELCWEKFKIGELPSNGTNSKQFKNETRKEIAHKLVELIDSL